MAQPSITDKKFLSAFTTRFIPSWWQQKYSKFTDFLRTVLEWMEQDEHVYENIANYDKYFDIDKIADLKNSTDPVKQELGNTLIDQVYIQYVGDANARYLSTLMDEVLYIKNQKNILKYKGTKYSFLFFFLLVLGGYFRVYTILGYMKMHNGVFRYDGSIFYGNGPTWVEPFIYLIRSEYPVDYYQKITQVLNPAGMIPFTIQFISKRATDPATIATAWAYSNAYMALYKDTTFVALVDCSEFLVNQVPAGDPYYIELYDASFWQIQTDLSDPLTKSILYEGNFNMLNFTGEFNKVYLYKDVLYSGLPITDYVRLDPPTTYTVLQGPIVTKLSGVNYQVVNNTAIAIVVTYT